MAGHVKYARQLADLEPLEKVQAAQDVAATMKTPGWSIIVDLLEGRRAKLLDTFVRDATVKTQAEYAAQSAECRGIALALAAGPSVLDAGEKAARELSEREGAVQ